MKPFRTFFIVVDFLMMVSSTFSGQSAHATSLYEGHDQTSLQIDKVFADLQQADSPGCAVGVFRDGRILYAQGYGLASIELNAPITAQTVFDIGSTSKQFTAASILLLEQQGKLSVNDSVRKYIPELPDYSKNGSLQEITILNLLNHTSGTRDYLALLQLSGVSGDSVTTDSDALALIVRQEGLNFTPGSEWAYSNTGFFLLSVVVKRISGMTLKEFASQNIFLPLEMTHTTFRDDHTMLIPHRALAYDPDEKAGYKLDVSYYEQLGDGGVHTSVEDLEKWDDNFYSGRVGGKRFLTEIQQPGKLNDGKVLDYAKGLFIRDYRGLHTVRHGGAWGGYRAELLRFPDQHFSVACLCNLGNANPEKRAERVAEVYLHNLMKPSDDTAINDENRKTPSVLTLTATQMAALAGLYRNPTKQTLARVSQADGKLQLEIYGSTFGMRALTENQFTLIDFPIDAKLTFTPETAGVSQLMQVSGDEMIAATYQKVPEFMPLAAQLAGYVGDFRSDELGVIYRLRVLDGKLQLVSLSDSSGIPRTGIPTPNPLRPTIADEFEISNLGMNLHFLKDEKNSVMGFNLTEGDIHDVKFLRTQQLGSSRTTF